MTQASRGTRVAASFITLGFGLAGYGIGLLLNKLTGQSLALVATVVLYDVVALLLLATRAASPGQLTLGLVTTDVTTGRPAGSKAVAKGAAMSVVAIATAGIGLLVGLLIKTPSTNQHLFDRMLGVSVVRRAAGSAHAGAPSVGRVLAPSSAFLAGAPLGSALVPAVSVVPPPVQMPAPAPAPAPAQAPAPAPIAVSAMPDAPTMVTHPASPLPPAMPAATPPPPAPPAPTEISPMPRQHAVAPPPPPVTAPPAAVTWRLELDQGSVLPLDRVWVFGRAPEAPPVLPTAEPFTIPDLAKSLSKTHLAVVPTPGGASVVDLHSTNGVTLGHPDGRSMKLTAGDAVPLEAGSVISFGRRTIVVHA